MEVRLTTKWGTELSEGSCRHEPEVVLVRVPIQADDRWTYSGRCKDGPEAYQDVRWRFWVSGAEVLTIGQREIPTFVIEQSRPSASETTKRWFAPTLGLFVKERTVGPSYESTLMLKDVEPVPD